MSEQWDIAILISKEMVLLDKSKSPNTWSVLNGPFQKNVSDADF